MKRFAIFCSGQGGQTSALFALTGNGSTSLLSADLVDALAAPASLFANRFAQPLLVAAGMARWQAIRPFIPVPTLIAGYSVGELTAYGVAGAIDTTALIDLARLRATVMDACVTPSVPQIMLAIGGLTRDDLLPILRLRGLFIAIENGIDRFVIGGLAHQAVDIEPQLIALGGTCQTLPVSVASHTPLMAAAAQPFAQALAKQSWSSMAIPVLSGVDAEKIGRAERAQSALVQQLTQTIFWRDCMDACAENGIEVVLELGPGDALSRMMRARHPSIESRSMDEFRSIDAATAWLIRQLQ